MPSQTLPVTYPPITTFPAYADTLAILMSHEICYDWVFSHYIQTFVIDILDGSENNLKPFMPCFFGDFDSRRIVNTIADCIFLNREVNPFLNIFEVPNEMIETVSNTYTSFIKKALDLSMYIYALVDVSKISDYRKNIQTAHEIFIYGYDDSKNIFYYADFPNTVSNKYNFSTCSYSEIEAAIHGIKNTFVPVVKSLSLIQFEQRGPFIFDIDYVKDSISDYLYPDQEKHRRLSMYIDSFVNSGEFNWETKLYMGIGVYDYLSDIHNRITDTGIDIRLFHAMYEHKEMMVKRIHYFIRKGYLNTSVESYLNEYTLLSNETLNIRNRILKYNITHNFSTISKIPQDIACICKKETILLNKIFNV